MKTAGHASAQCRSGRFSHPESQPFCKALVSCGNWVGSSKWGKVVRQTRAVRGREAVSLLKAIKDAPGCKRGDYRGGEAQQSGGLGRRPRDCRRFCAKGRVCRVRTGAASGRGFMLSAGLNPGVSKVSCGDSRTNRGGLIQFVGCRVGSGGGEAGGIPNEA